MQVLCRDRMDDLNYYREPLNRGK